MNLKGEDCFAAQSSKPVRVKPSWRKQPPFDKSSRTRDPRVHPFHSCTRSIHRVSTSKTSADSTRMQDAPRVSAIIRPPRGGNPPGLPPPGRTTWTTNHQPTTNWLARQSRWVKYPSPLSSSYACSTTCRLERAFTGLALPHDRRLPCRLLAGSRHSYSGHTPALQRLNHLADNGQAPGTTPATTAHPRLVMVSGQIITSLGEVTPRVIAVCPRLPPRHSFYSTRALQFRGPETRRVPLPIDNNVSQFGTVFDLTLPVRACAPFMVELFTVGFYRPIAERCHPPGRTCRQARAPHTGQR